MSYSMEERIKARESAYSKGTLAGAEARERRSQEYEARYQTVDEYMVPDYTALRDFCRIDPFAFKTPWVQTALQTAVLTGKSNTLSSIFKAGKGQGACPLARKIDNLIIMDAIDRLQKATGLPKNHPNNSCGYDSVYNLASACRKEFDVFTAHGINELSATSLLNRYQEAKKQAFDVMIQHEQRGFFFRMGPCLMEIDGVIMIGINEIFYPDLDGGDVISTEFINVYNTPEGTEAIKLLGNGGPDALIELLKKFI